MNSIPIFVEKDNLPSHVGHLVLGNINIYSEKAYGVSIHYYAGADIKADVYLYNLGISELPQNMKSSEMSELFQMSYSEIISAAQQGIYENLEVMTSRYLRLPGSNLEPKCWMWSAFRYKPASPQKISTFDLVSHLAMRIDRGFINKVRYTYSGHLEEQEFSHFLEFLVEWRQAVQSFQIDTKNQATHVDGLSPDLVAFTQLFPEFPGSKQVLPLSFFNLQTLMEKEAESAKDIVGEYSDDKAIPYQGRNMNAYTSEGLYHEVSHAIFSLLEDEMALTVNIAGFPRRIDLRPPKETKEPLQNSLYGSSVQYLNVTISRFKNSILTALQRYISYLSTNPKK
jgi:hypothetical protein